MKEAIDYFVKVAPNKTKPYLTDFKEELMIESDKFVKQVKFREKSKK